jgi:hypothetical protein
VSRYAAEPPSEDGAVAGSAEFRNARTLRPGSSIAVGIVGALAGLSLLIPALLSSNRGWGLIGTVVLALVMLWLFVVRPAAIVHDEGIRLVNPLSVVDLTWPVVTEVRSKWALELVAQGRKYTAWGVPADSRRPRHGRDLFTMRNRAGMGQPAASAPPPRPKVEARTVAAEIEAIIEADRQRPDGQTPRIARQSLDPMSVGLLAGAVLFFLIGAFVL